MKGLKCTKYLVLFITLLVGLGIYSNVSAYRYDVDSATIGNPYYVIKPFHDSRTDSDVYAFWTRSQTLSYIVPTTVLNSPDNFPHFWTFSGEYTSSFDGDWCDLKYYHDGVNHYNRSYGGVDYSVYDTDNFYNPSLRYDDLAPFVNQLDTRPITGTFFNDFSEDPRCSIYDFRYDAKDQPSTALAFAYAPRWNWSSLNNIPPFNNVWDYRKSIPYFYRFNRLHFAQSSAHNGIQYDSDGLHMSSIVQDKDKVVSELDSLVFNFTLFDSPTNTLNDSDWSGYDDPNVTTNTSNDFELIENFIFRGSIVFDSDYTINGSVIMYFDQYLKDKFDSTDTNSYTINDQTVYQISNSPQNIRSKYLISNEISCNYYEYHRGNGSEENRLDFACSYNPLDYYEQYYNDGIYPYIDFEYSNLSIAFLGSLGGIGPFLQTDGDYRFTDFNIVTNGNYYPVDIFATDSGSGGTPDEAPGGANDPYSDITYDPNYNASLADMFNFGFLNPFAPLFNMFTDNNSCVNIPTLASMLHSNETQVCPWFSSTTRNIVTPVLGISSMMLIFGFAVRWLGASSGNLFEDSHSTENYEFKSKYRRNSK